jgi:hypothetical protein
MTKKSRQKHSRFATSKTRKNTTGKHKIKNTLMNSIVGILSLLLIVFIYSFSKKYTQTGVSMNTLEVTFPSFPDQPELAKDLYEQNPVLEIEVEVLNGCGKNGFLRSNQFDVVRSEDADHFGYTQTLLISRNENYEALKLVTSSLGFDIEDKSRVLIQPDETIDADITLIVGKDYSSIEPISDFLSTQF